MDWFGDAQNVFHRVASHPNDLFSPCSMTRCRSFYGTAHDSSLAKPSHSHLMQLCRRFSSLTCSELSYKKTNLIWLRRRHQSNGYTLVILPQNTSPENFKLDRRAFTQSSSDFFLPNTDQRHGFQMCCCSVLTRAGKRVCCIVTRCWLPGSQELILIFNEIYSFSPYTSKRTNVDLICAQCTIKEINKQQQWCSDWAMCNNYWHAIVN